MSLVKCMSANKNGELCTCKYSNTTLSHDKWFEKGRIKNLSHKSDYKTRSIS